MQGAHEAFLLAPFAESKRAAAFTLVGPLDKTLWSQALCGDAHSVCEDRHPLVFSPANG